MSRVARRLAFTLPGIPDASLRRSVSRPLSRAAPPRTPATVASPCGPSDATICNRRTNARIKDVERFAISVFTDRREHGANRKTTDEKSAAVVDLSAIYSNN